jgi:hypothetical protein
MHFNPEEENSKPIREVLHNLMEFEQFQLWEELAFVADWDGWQVS